MTIDTIRWMIIYTLTYSSSFDPWYYCSTAPVKTAMAIEVQKAFSEWSFSRFHCFESILDLRIVYLRRHSSIVYPASCRQNWIDISLKMILYSSLLSKYIFRIASLVHSIYLSIVTVNCRMINSQGLSIMYIPITTGIFKKKQPFL